MGDASANVEETVTPSLQVEGERCSVGLSEVVTEEEEVIEEESNAERELIEEVSPVEEELVDEEDKEEAEEIKED